MRPQFHWNSFTNLIIIVSGVPTSLLAPSPRSGELPVTIEKLARKAVIAVSLRNQIYFTLAQLLVILLSSRASFVPTAPALLFTCSLLLITQPSLGGQKHFHSTRHCLGTHKNIRILQWFFSLSFNFLPH